MDTNTEPISEEEFRKFILSQIKIEIEEKYNCIVESIRFAELLSLCVSFKVKFKDDFLYKPFDSGLPKPYTICFSEKSANFSLRLDLFDTMKKKI